MRCGRLLKSERNLQRFRTSARCCMALNHCRKSFRKKQLTKQKFYSIINKCSARAQNARVAQWWSTTLPRWGPRVRVPSRASFFTGDESSPVFIFFQQEEFFSISLFVSPSNFFAKPSKSAFSSNCRQRNFVLTYLSQPSLVCDFCPSNQRFAYSFL